MSIIKEVTDGIDLIASSIRNIKTIVDTVKDGKGYLDSRYKEAKADVVQMLDEMGKTMITMSKISSIITHFSFINDPAHYVSDMEELRDQIRNSKSELEALEQNIDSNRGHCSVIRHHAEKIKEGNKLDSLFRIFGIDSKEKNEELSGRLRRIYDDEHNQYMAVDMLCANLKIAIDDVYNTLGGAGMIDPTKVPDRKSTRLNSSHT